jgi:acyl-CoA reductase-like NAD-dependent aldehyde dehydrogenase
MSEGVNKKMNDLDYVEALWKMERAKEVAIDFLRRAERATENGELRLAEWATQQAQKHIQRARGYAKVFADTVEQFAEVLSRVEQGSKKEG